MGIVSASSSNAELVKFTPVIVKPSSNSSVEDEVEAEKLLRAPADCLKGVPSRAVSLRKCIISYTSVVGYSRYEVSARCR